MEGTGIAAISALLPRRHIDLRLRQPEYRRKAHRLQSPATRKQLRIQSSRLPIQNSRLPLRCSKFALQISIFSIHEPMFAQTIVDRRSLSLATPCARLERLGSVPAEAAALPARQTEGSPGWENRILGVAIIKQNIREHTDSSRKCPASLHETMSRAWRSIL